MRTVAPLFALLAFVGPALSQGLDITDLPSCMSTCLATATASAGDCELTDIPCLCGNEEFIQNSVACIIDSCEGDELTQSVEGSAQLCEEAGAPISEEAAASADAAVSSKLAGATPSATAPSESESTESPDENDESTEGNGAASSSAVGAGIAAVFFGIGAALV